VLRKFNLTFFWIKLHVSVPLKVQNKAFPIKHSFLFSL